MKSINASNIFLSSSSVSSVAVTPDGKYVVSGSSDETIKLWDIKTGEVIRTFEGHTSYVSSVAVTSNGKYVVSGSWDETIKLWDIKTGEIIKEFKGHTSYVSSVAVTPDGKYIVSGSDDKTIKLWDIKICECNRCHKKISCDDKFCIYCGNSLNNQSSQDNSCYCNNCGKLVNCDDKFCKYCGSPLNKIDSELYNLVLHSIDGIFVALISKIAKADGRICKEEANYISDLLTTLSNQRSDIPNIREIYKQIINKEKNTLSNIDTLCIELNAFNVEEKYKIDLIRMMVELAYIDSDYSEKEENVIVRIAHNLYIDFSIYKNIKNEFESQRYSNNNKNNNYKYNGRRISLLEAYEILESKESDSNKTIKDNYHRLVKQYHYDSIVSKNLPKDMIEFAEEKLKMINVAYDVIKKYRDM